MSYDPNVRPRLLGDADTARRSIEGMVALAHVVKVSDEDLAWLCPGEDVADVARSWVELGPGARRRDARSRRLDRGPPRSS